ncbi:hypothetical protein DFJ75_4991 [Williamsia muralis]|uniref:Large polyvalent protein associated domain-containing protein n=1 Tax=Williamsia marianensis TaxID=85044 RepID=A0A495IV31_WILMA|nr:LPD29 domain-containing protein [Williamsia muralis]RKR79848.1 hypothetical protein DFJ75_4991 [Williamsia muralis]
MPKFTTKETAAELRKHLRATWPTVKFSVRSGRGTASAWLRVAWVDGPAYTQAQNEWFGFQSAQFNGMTDSYDQLDDRLVCTDPAKLPDVRSYSCDGINGERTFTDDAVRTTVRQLMDENTWISAAFAVEGIDPDALTYNTLHRSASMLTLDAGRWLSYLGEPLPRNPYDLGTAITSALSLTDFTTPTPALHTR